MEMLFIIIDLSIKYGARTLQEKNLTIKYIKHNYSAIQLYFICVHKVWKNEKSLVTDIAQS